MYSSAVAELKNNRETLYWGNRSKDESGFLVIRVPSKQGSRFYAVKNYVTDLAKDRIGSGAFGDIYSFTADEIDTATGKVFNNDEKTDERKKRFVIKLVKKSEDKEEQKEEEEALRLEAKLFREISNVGEFIKFENQTYNLLLMEYLPGEDVAVHSALSKNVKDLPLAKRVEMAAQMAALIHGFHHFRPHRQEHTIVHRDIKGANFKVNIQNVKNDGKHGANEKKVDVYLLDFGMAHQMKSDSPHEKSKATYKGTPFYTPPEVFEDEKNPEVGLKNDVFSFSPVVAALLGAKAPFENKREAAKKMEKERKEKQREAQQKLRRYNPVKHEAKVKEGPSRDIMKALTKIDFNFDGVLEEKIAGFPDNVDIQTIVVNFLNLMKEPNYEKRANSDETLRFFVTLSKLFILKEQKGNEDDMCIGTAKLLLLSKGWWSQLLEPGTGKNKCEQFDWDDNPEVARIINQNKLQQSQVYQLLNKRTALSIKKIAKFKVDKDALVKHNENSYQGLFRFLNYTNKQQRDAADLLMKAIENWDTSALYQENPKDKSTAIKILMASPLRDELACILACINPPSHTPKTLLSALQNTNAKSQHVYWRLPSEPSNHLKHEKDTKHLKHGNK